MIPQMSPEVYQTYFNYLTFGIPPIQTISIACETCKSHELVILSQEKKVKRESVGTEIYGHFVFYCPYCYHIEKVEIFSTCLNMTAKEMSEIIQGLKS